MTSPAESAAPPPLVEPRARNWDETPREAARADRAWFDRDIDNDRDEEN